MAYLIGDAGDDFSSTTLYPQLRREVVEASKRSEVVVVFLGDNIYPAGLREPSSSGHARDRERLDAQIDLVKGTGATALFLPGNHDWGHGASDGWRRVRRQSEYLARVARTGVKVKMLPQRACPGPERHVTRAAVFVGIDTEWWLRDEDERAPGCRLRSESDVERALAKAIAPTDRPTIVLGHHPLETRGPHGGYFGAQDTWFPGTNLWSGLLLPMPFIYPVFRRSGITNQDVSGGRNSVFRERLSTLFRRLPTGPLAYASGHEHGLQVFDGKAHGSGVLLVSGAGCKLRPIDDAAEPGRLFAAGEDAEELGLMRLVFSGSRAVLEVLTDGTRDCAATPCKPKLTVRFRRKLETTPG